MPVSWERFDNSEDEKELWFKLIDGKQLEPYASVSFPDLQVSWKNDEGFSCTIMGFVFSETETEGVTSLNSISLNIK